MGDGVKKIGESSRKNPVSRNTSRINSAVAAFVVSAAAGGVLALAAIPKFEGLAETARAQEMAIESLQAELSLLKHEQLDLYLGLDAQAMVLEGGLSRVDGLQNEFKARTAAMEEDPALVRRRTLERDILGPVFQLSGGDAVGSAVLIHRSEDPADPHYLAFTCQHVVRDILEEEGVREDLLGHDIRALFEPMDGPAFQLTAHMVAENTVHDLAILRIETGMDLGPVASLAPKVRSDQVEVFDPIYTVGCPLGTAAQATRGEITRTQWEVDGENYWMVSSPAFFGNSGGGVFLEETHELVGIFSKIYTHGSFRPQVVTHMGLSVPLPTIHDWVAEAGFAHILPRDPADLRLAEASMQD